MSRLLWFTIQFAVVGVGAAKKCSLDIPARPKQQKTLKIMRRAWVSHELVSEVASILLENVLMYDVEWHRPKASPLDDFRALSLGEADVNFEVWQGGKAEELQRWVRSDSAEVVGSHSMLAYDGIHTLKHTIDRFPEAEFYQYLQTPQMSWVFASDAFQQGESFADPGNLCRDQRWNCTDFVWQPPHCREEVRCVGQVLHDYPHYSQGVMEQQIANNGLPLSTVYLTPLSKQVAVWNAFASKRNILFQHHFPSEGVDGVPSSAFVPIQFSPKRYGCNSTESSSPDGGFSCHLEAKRLLIVASPAFVTEGDAAYFAERFRLDKESYDRLFDLWRQHDGDAYQAACRWLQETGSSKWGGWIRFSKQVDFIREFPPMSGCFPTFYLFFLAAVTVAFTEKYLLKSLKACKRWCTRPPAQNPNWEPTDLSDIQRRMNDRASYTTPDFTSKLVASRSASFVEVKMALLKGSMGFMSFFRDEEDFCEDSGRAMIPPQASSCFRQYFHSSLQVLIYIVTSGLANIAVSALTFALATGMVGALLAEVRATKENNKQVDPLLQVEDWYTNWLSDMQTVTVLIDDFKFLPTFFITYMIGQDVTRWLEWLRTMFRVQGRLHDVGLVVATSYRKVNDPQIGKQQRQMLFKWYRYLNAIHYLGYFKLAPSIGASGDEVLQDLRTAGLLKEAECQQLQFAGTKLRDTLVSWLGTLWHDELERGWVQSSDSDVFMRKICELRGILAQLSDMQDLRISQMVRVMMVVVTNILLGLALIGYPTKMYEDTTECIQFWPLIACYLYFICYRGMLHVMFLLDKGPFYAKGDCVNIDALLISTERYMFHIFRTSFKSSQQKNTKYPLPDRPQEPAAV
ncbi:Putative metal chaperone YciC [Durusdinium trenchii]|uniref:Metal chaperone YciC n=1 Tax=Durusdinium trenchii TaxID=1381693 RepID=A0ABP0PGH3_9DINO